MSGSGSAYLIVFNRDCEGGLLYRCNFRKHDIKFRENATLNAYFEVCPLHEFKLLLSEVEVKRLRLHCRILTLVYVALYLCQVHDDGPPRRQTG